MCGITHQSKICSDFESPQNDSEERCGRTFLDDFATSFRFEGPCLECSQSPVHARLSCKCLFVVSVIAWPSFPSFLFNKSTCSWLPCLAERDTGVILNCPGHRKALTGRSTIDFVHQIRKVHVEGIG
jgi:hypothetical protein